MKYSNTCKTLRQCHGQSIIEIIVAMAVFSLVSASLVSIILGSFNSLTRSAEMMQAKFIAQQAMEAVRAIRDRSFNELMYDRSAILSNANSWALSGEGTTEQIGKFSRVLEFFPVWRNKNTYEISTATSTDAFLDVGSKLVTVAVSWPINASKTKEIIRSEYLTNWNSLDWTQSDWSGGEGQEIWNSDNMFFLSDSNINYSAAGQIALAEVATSTFAVSGYIESSAFKINTNNFNTLAWKETLSPDCADCSIKLQIKTAADLSGAPDVWTNTWSGPEGDDNNEDDFYATSTGAIINSDHNGDQWIKYRLYLYGNASSTPICEEVKINYKK